MSFVELEDGTRIYSSGYRYRPKTGKRYRKCPPGHTLYNGDFYGPLDVLPEGERIMPRTLADTDGATHTIACGCMVCKDNPWATWHRRKALGLKGPRPE